MAGLRPGRDSDPGPAALDGRHLDRAAERGGRERDRHAAEDVGAVALKDRVLRDADEDVEIAWRRGAQPDLTFACEADAGAVFDARRNVDRQRLLAPHAALSAAGLARLLDRLADAMAGRAGAL